MIHQTDDFSWQTFSVLAKNTIVNRGFFAFDHNCGHKAKLNKCKNLTFDILRLESLTSILCLFLLVPNISK